ncbi:hypothetical protein [Aeromicrobium sp.]|uniref:hypothetical protein n=1 Tax=Aeromicrobium sp. TaxID=1871063 RepID=UPI0030C2ABF0
MIRALAVLSATALTSGMVACGADAPERQPLPSDVTMQVDQTRLERKTRNAFVRVDNDSGQTMVVSRFVLSSPRFDDVQWQGDETLEPGQQADLEFVMPPSRCGKGVEASVKLTYRLGDSGARESEAAADDPFQSIGLLMDRDCARNTLAEAADLRVGTPTVVGSGGTSLLNLPITLTPTGKRDDIRFGGFESTPLFRQAGDSPVDVDTHIDPSSPTEIVMSVAPARCDPHALAEDKVGRLFGIRVLAPELPRGSSFYLPLDRDQRLAFYDYIRARCGL